MKWDAVLSAGAAIAAILSGVVVVTLTVGDVRSELANKDDKIAELHLDLREVRDGWVRHLESHSDEEKE